MAVGLLTDASVHPRCVLLIAKRSTCATYSLRKLNIFLVTMAIVLRLVLPPWRTHHTLSGGLLLVRHLGDAVGGTAVRGSSVHKVSSRIFEDGATGVVGPCHPILAFFP